VSDLEPSAAVISRSGATAVVKIGVGVDGRVGDRPYKNESVKIDGPFMTGDEPEPAALPWVRVHWFDETGCTPQGGYISPAKYEQIHSPDCLLTAPASTAPAPRRTDLNPGASTLADPGVVASIGDAGDLSWVHWFNATLTAQPWTRLPSTESEHER
jgi:hypothetical protein